MTRPSARVALADLTAASDEMPKPVLKAMCNECNRSPGHVLRTAHGWLWVGYLRNPTARALHGEETYMPLWLEDWRTVLGECRCSVDTGIDEPGWPRRSSRMHAFLSAVVLENVRAGRRVLRA